MYFTNGMLLVLGVMFLTMMYTALVRSIQVDVPSCEKYFLQRFTVPYLLVMLSVVTVIVLTRAAGAWIMADKLIELLCIVFIVSQMAYYILAFLAKRLMASFERLLTQ